MRIKYLTNRLNKMALLLRNKLKLIILPNKLNFFTNRCLNLNKREIKESEFKSFITTKRDLKMKKNKVNYMISRS
jgi:hypothetical protein